MDAFRDPIFRGCTRPAMFMGIPMLPFLLVTGAFLIPGAWICYLLSPYAALFLFVTYVPVLLTMRTITKTDDQRLLQLMLRARMRIRQKDARRHWGAVSYSPLRYKRRS